MSPRERRPAEVDPIDLRALLEDLRGFLEHLPSAQREAFEMADLHGLRPVEVAALSGRSPGTIRSNLLRARRKVRERFSAERPEFVSELAD